MAVSKLSFTNDRLMKLPVPEKGRAYHYDEKVPGLCICVTHAASRTFYFYRKVDGRPQRNRLGKFPDVSIDAARDAAKEMTGEIAKGRDPAAERRSRRESLTLGGLYDHWIQYAKSHKRTWQEDERLYNNFLEKWQNRSLAAIRKQDIRALHTTIGEENGRYAANRVLGLLKAMYNRAVSDLDWGGTNPAEGVTRFREKSRDRFLQPDELPRFFEALDEESDLLKDFFLVALFTGARRSNVQAMRWEEIGVDGVWRIPDTKSGQPVLVPLVPEVTKILQARREKAGGNPWVFPSRGQSGHLVEPKSAWKRIRTAANLPDLRMHDLRRTLGSWQVATGASLPIIGKMLGHGDGSKATAVYARLNLAPVRESANKAVSAMVAAGKPQLESDPGVGDD